MKKIYGLVLLIIISLSAFAQSEMNFVPVTSESDLYVGGKYIITNANAVGDAYVLGGQKTSNRAANQISITASGIAATEATTNSTTAVSGEVVTLTLGESNGRYTFHDEINNGYLYAASATANQLKCQAAVDENAEWSITFESGVASIVATNSTNRNVLKYNVNSSNGGSPLFSCYAPTSVMEDVYLFMDVNAATTDPIMSVSSPANNAVVYAADVQIALNIRNFTLGTDGKVKYIVDGGETQYSETATIQLNALADGSHIVTLELVTMQNASLSTPVTAEVAFTTDADGPTITSIHDIQYTEETTGVSPFDGSAVFTTGVVTAKTQYGFYLQSSNEAWNGLYVYSPSYLSAVALGDSIVLGGTISEYNGLTELAEISYLENVSNVETQFTPIEIEISEVAEQYEAMLVKVAGNYSGTLNGAAWQISQDANSIYVDDDCFAFTPETGMNYIVTGVLSINDSETGNGWVVLPRKAADVEGSYDGVTLIVDAPADNTEIYATSVTFEYRVYNFDLGTDGKLKYFVNEEAAQYTTETSFLINDLTDGTYSVTLELVDMDNASLSPAVSRTVNFTVSTSGPTIYSVQYTTDPSGNSPKNGETVTVSGVVTGLIGDKFYMQDGEGQWNGIYVYNTTAANTPALNDNVTVTGLVSEYNGLTELTPTAVVNNGAAAAVAPVAIQMSAVGESYEGVLVTVEGTCVQAIGTYGIWEISDGTSLSVDDQIYAYQSADINLGISYTLTGIISYSFGDWVILPRSADDIIAGQSVPSISITNPANATEIYSTAILATVSVFNFTIGTDGNISYSLDGAAATTTTETSFAITGLTEGSHTLNVSLVDNASAQVATAQSTFTVNLAGPAYTSIHDVQYTEDATGDSPYKNQTVWMKGVVTANFQNDPYPPVKGYAIQDGNSEWCGIWVFDTIHNPSIGDSVKFQAVVAEYYGLTEMETVTNYEVFDIGVVPAPILITAAQANTENYEACLVKVECAKSSGSTMQYGNWNCVNATNDTVKYSHSGSFDLTIATGTNYSCVGVIDYSYGEYYVNYRMQSDVTTDCEMGIEDSEIALDIYPNPACDFINVVTENASQIDVINILGEVVKSVTPKSNTEVINIESLSAGTYFVRVTENGNSHVSKIIVE